MLCECSITLPHTQTLSATLKYEGDKTLEHEWSRTITYHTNAVWRDTTSTRHYCKCVHTRQPCMIQDWYSTQNWAMLTLMDQQQLDEVTQRMGIVVSENGTPSIPNPAKHFDIGTRRTLHESQPRDSPTPWCNREEAAPRHKITENTPKWAPNTYTENKTGSKKWYALMRAGWNAWIQTAS